MCVPPQVVSQTQISCMGDTRPPKPHCLMLLSAMELQLGVFTKTKCVHDLCAHDAIVSHVLWLFTQVYLHA